MEALRNSHEASFASCAVIIVTHNSQSVLDTCLRSLSKQTVRPRQIIVVDSGSADIEYLNECSGNYPITLHIEGHNSGYCAGNNKGMGFVESTIQYVLFLNPDAFLTPRFIEHAIAHLEHPLAQEIGALTGLLLGYDLLKNQPTGLIDSTGIFQTWYGRWYDRGQGQACAPFPEEYCSAQYVPAICGALLFCRYEALKKVELQPNVVMDPSFFMYKEDIDLSLRLRQKGWDLLYVPDLIAFHCRGWKRNRADIPIKFRLMSANNEMSIYKKLKSPLYFAAALKYWLVKGWNI